jgi:hypothetical protein
MLSETEMIEIHSIFHSLAACDSSYQDQGDGNVWRRHSCETRRCVSSRDVIFRIIIHDMQKTFPVIYFARAMLATPLAALSRFLPLSLSSPHAANDRLMIIFVASVRWIIHNFVIL